MKNLRKVIPTICMLMTAAMLLGTSTFAWFSMNKTVSVTGMEVTAVAEGNLVINKLTEVPAHSTDVLTTFAGQKYDLKAITYTESGSSGTWQIPADPTLINQNTGVAGSSGLVNIESGKFTEAVTSAGVATSGYYKDYLIYIASAGENLVNQTLYVKFNELSGLTDMYKGALSVAFYINKKEADSSVAPDKILHYSDFTKVSGSTEVFDSSVAEKEIGTVTTIPSCAHEMAGIPILLRVFFDGDLESKIHEDIYTVVPAPDSSAVADYFVRTDTNTYEAAPSSGAFTYSLTYYTHSSGTTNYINSKNIPTTNCSFSLDIIAKDTETH